MSRLLGRSRESIERDSSPPPVRRDDIRDAVFRSYVSKRDNEEEWHRPYLGASDIGHACPRHVFYVFYHAKKAEFDGRILRLFNRGHREEPQIEEDLRRIGLQVSTLGEDGKQHEFFYANGHGAVHLDGMVNLKAGRMLVEFKTMSEKKWKACDSKGVRKANPEYYKQIQMQLHAAKHLGITKCLFVSVCKNTDNMYFEEVSADEKMQKKLLDLALKVTGGEAPPKLKCAPTSVPCRWCDFKDICREDMLHLIEKNCRTCQHSETWPGGEFTCAKGRDHGIVCEDWLLGAKFQ